MKKVINLITIVILSGFFSTANAQSDLRLGIGSSLFNLQGSSKTVIELEIENRGAGKNTRPFRSDLGIYNPGPDELIVYIDANWGLRQYLDSKLFLEESVGIGVQVNLCYPEGTSRNNGLGALSVDGDPFLMPSITLGLGIDLSRENTGRHLLWLRPKMYWLVDGNVALPASTQLLLGYSFTLGGRQ